MNPDVLVSQQLVAARKALQEIEGFISAMSLKCGRTVDDVDKATDLAIELKTIAEFLKL